MFLRRYEKHVTKAVVVGVNGSYLFGVLFCSLKQTIRIVSIIVVRPVSEIRFAVCFSTNLVTLRMDASPLVRD